MAILGSGIYTTLNSGKIIDDSLYTDLTAYFRLEDNLLDSVSLSLSGTPSGSYTPQYQTGRIGNALSFTGNSSDYITIPDDEAIAPSTDIVSVFTWFNSSVSTFTSTLCDNNDGANGYAIYVTNSQIRVYLGAVSDTTSYTFSANTWYNIGFTYDRPTETLKTYVNGSCIGTGTSISYNVDTTENLRVGNGLPTGAGSTTPINGLISEIAVWNRLLEDSEIISLYNKTNYLF